MAAAVAVLGHNEEAVDRNRKSAEIPGQGSGSRADTAQRQRSVQSCRAVGKDDPYRAIIDRNENCVLVSEGGVEVCRIIVCAAQRLRDGNCHADQPDQQRCAVINPPHVPGSASHIDSGLWHGGRTTKPAIN